MKLSSISVHLVAPRGFLQKHAIHRGNHQELRFKSEHQLSNCTHGYSLSARNVGNHLVLLRLRSNTSVRKYHKVFAKIQGNDDPENSWKTLEDVLRTSSRNCESNQSSENLPTSSRITNPHLEEDSQSQSIPKEELLPYSFDYQDILDKLKAVLLHVLASGQWNASRLKLCHRNYFVSAENLVHYLTLHCLDDRQLKDELSSVGLLNLECANSHVLASITSGIKLLEKQAPSKWDTYLREYIASDENDKVIEFNISSMRTRASMHATSLLGPVRDEKDVHIMVTVGREAITNETLLSDLLKAGAKIIRINCSHDDCSIWSEIIRQAKHSSQMMEKPCRILMDLAGPKLRTGLLSKGPNVMKISPKKDAQGNVIVPAQVWLSFSGCGPPSHLSPDAVLFVDNEQFLKKLEGCNILSFVDVRGRKRSLTVSKKYSVFAGYGYMVECARSAYVESGTRLKIEKKKGKDSVGHIVNVPSAEQFVRLSVGDLLTIRRGPTLSSNNVVGSSIGDLKITCDSGRLFDSVKPGEPIAFDDGRIWGVIQGVSNNEIVVSITRASLKGSKLGSGKSINIPESSMQFEGLTSKDLQDLEFVASNADMVGISFIRDTRDIEIVMKELAKRKLKDLGVVLKIETQAGYEKLPLLLLQAMRAPNPLGVMIARGDLAVECGLDRMAGIQEEILSICSAAHIPVIWATQVLESLVKYGIPTRAEITDVACGMRANCVMLNKGKYIVEAVSSLHSIIHNGSTKGSMKTLLRPLLPSS